MLWVSSSGATDLQEPHATPPIFLAALRLTALLAFNLWLQGYEHPIKGQGIWAYVTLKEVRHPVLCTAGRGWLGEGASMAATSLSPAHALL